MSAEAGRFVDRHPFATVALLSAGVVVSLSGLIAGTLWLAG